MKQYEVLRDIFIGGQMVAKGEVVELDTDTANILLSQGAIKVKETKKSTKK